ncbi:hypothetical protein [Marinobacter sp. 1_MG-2023]|uniref:hypothetical protein n=1 Tax=Marinobacter sp. 1_MG-2023 TaxID=3062627 RepID=UPI0026E239BB|nr:hypothetical protein [Marinobacter sp. 1_MG-2023]MDO6825130.1 hypothetical protein [Marinobacter sp. 1_MG-2023]
MIALKLYRPFKGIAFLFAVAGLLVMQAGCATYYSHYAMFSAENSRGAPRAVRLSWHTAEYPSWWFLADRATPILLETQCSERDWHLYDDSHAEAGTCARGIRACGLSGHDRRAPEGEVAGSGDVCMAVNPSDPQARIAELSGQLELLVSCEAVSDVKGEGKGAMNVDYIRASAVPYSVYSRKTVRGAMSARPPEFDRTVCSTD